MITDQVVRIALFGAEWVMWLLLALSVVSVWIIVDRGMMLRSARPQVIAAAVRRAREEGIEGIEPLLVRERLRMENGLGLLATIGSNAPFVGLLGTVIGVIVAFHDLSKNVMGGPGLVMAGISEALVATAVGLFVAIPAVVTYNIYSRQVRRVMAEAEAEARDVVLEMRSTGISIMAKH